MSAGEATAQGADSAAAKPRRSPLKPTDEPALLPGVPSAKPLRAARAADRCRSGHRRRQRDACHALGDCRSRRDTAITDQAVQPAAYQVAAPPAEETAPAAQVPASAVDAATAGEHVGRRHCRRRPAAPVDRRCHRRCRRTRGCRCQWPADAASPPRRPWRPAARKPAAPRRRPKSIRSIGTRI